MTHGGRQGFALPAEPHELESALGQLEPSLTLVDLRDLTITAASPALSQRFTDREGGIVGSSVLDWFAADDRPRVHASLDALGRGLVESYRARRRFVLQDGTVHEASVWTKVITFASRRIALAQIDFYNAPLSPLGSLLGQEPVEIAIGRIDFDFMIAWVSCDIVPLVGVEPAALEGTRMLAAVDPRDVRALISADAALSDDMSVAIRVTINSPARGPVELCCVLTRLVGSTDMLFTLTRPVHVVEGERGSAERASQLEQSLRRIAAEVEASGVLHRFALLPDAASAGEMKNLTSRQWEVLSHLLRGERVPTIAQELFISQSTVRNHLAGIFERFGVHSQPELLAALARRDPSALPG
ncbi:MAG: response regulator transcription factor [Actinomycetota bacterium]